MAKKLNELEKKASLKALGDYRSEAQKLMKDKMKNLKKVTVASDSEEGLKEGLEKAEDLIKGSDMYSSEQANDNFEDRDDHDESEFEEESDCEEMSDDEINAKIQELLALQKKKASK